MVALSLPGFDVQFLLSMLARFALATALCGVIGYEREHSGRPAGFRTHILVGVGACLVMLTSEFVFLKYAGQTNLDPARLGAQVISGVGFLGAGTIIRDGSTVKGLTTAASLWAVSCIGLACGIGFYSGAAVGTIATIATLMIFKKLEKSAHKKKSSLHNTLILEISRIDLDMQQVIKMMENLQTKIHSFQLLECDEAHTETVHFRIQTESISPLKKAELIDNILKHKSVIRLVEE